MPERASQPNRRHVRVIRAVILFVLVVIGTAAGAHESEPLTRRDSARVESPPSVGTRDESPVRASESTVDTACQAAIERSVARHLHSLREELRAMRSEVRLRDVLGGIGYLFGLAGLALWWHNRRSGASR